MSDSTNTSAAPEYVGRHRPTAERVGAWPARSTETVAFYRDHEAWWFGYNYAPKHSAANPVSA